MEHISKTLAAVPNESATDSMKLPSGTSRKTGIPKSWVSALFKHFQVIYGHRFNSVIDGVEQIAVQRWSECLGGLTGEQIKKGLDICGKREIKDGKDDWPPTPAEFRSLCLQASSKPYHNERRIVDGRVQVYNACFGNWEFKALTDESKKS